MGYIKKIWNVILNEITIKKHTSKQRNQNIWLFGEWFGERCCDNCLYLANFVCQNYPNLDLYWVAKKNCDISLLDTKVHVLEYGSDEAIKIFNIAGVVIMNQGFSDFSKEGKNYFGGAITVNLWHGIPWKKIGHDASKNVGILHEINTYIADRQWGSKIYLTLSQEYSRIAKLAFHAKEEYMIKAGAPRNSLFYDVNAIHTCRLKILERVHEITKHQWNENVKIITYMPTFRDSTSQTFSMNQLLKQDGFAKWLEEENVIILQRMHYMNSGVTDELKNERIIIFNDFTSQEILAATDLLVTDYSSCFFDYLVLDRPIVHWLYDYKYYATKDRGLYYEWQDVVCGDVAFEVDELLQYINENIDNPKKRQGLREKRSNSFLEYESPDSCRVLANELMNIIY